MRRQLLLAWLLACGGCATTHLQQVVAPVAAQRVLPEVEPGGIVVPASVVQGGLVRGRVPAGSVVVYDQRRVRVGADGTFIIGVSRERVAPALIELTLPGVAAQTLSIAVQPRQFAIERINGVPADTVNPPPDIAKRIELEQVQVQAVRTRDDDRNDFAEAFIWPLTGRISGVFGSQRVYNGTPKSPHSGLDVAAAKGTAVKAPAGGIITFANPDLYLTGGTVLIDHGHGLSSNFLHLSRIDVKVGERIEQGQVIGLVGATGRATGPHMHWGMNWFDVRIDPQLLVDPAENPQ